LESRPDKQGSRISYQVREGVYNFKRSSLTDVKEAKGKVHTEVRQAFTAVRLAQRAGASDLAAEELKEAQRVLDQTLALLKGGRDRSEIEARAHEAIRLAVAAQNLATDRALLGARAIEEGSGGGTATLEGAIGEDLRHIQIKDQCK
jgi:hypothetical protein